MSGAVSDAVYIQPLEYTNYGIADASYAKVEAASRLADGYLRRPEGMLWMPDANGQPAWMAALTPTRSFKAAVALTPGTAVSLTIPGAAFGFRDVGEVVLIDRFNKTAVETCIITAACGNTLTFGTVQFNHAIGATLEFGVALLDEVKAQNYKKTIRTSRAPVATILSAFGRFVFDPSMLQLSSGWLDPFLLSGVGAVTDTLQWQQLDLSQCDLNYSTGVIWFLPGIPQSGFTELRLRYVAGWQYSTLPDGIKRAVANIVRNGIDSSDLPGNIKMAKSGDATLEKFGDSVLDSDTKALLAPYKMMRM